MNKESEQRSELVSRYVSGDLSAEEVQAIEFAMLDDPELLEEVELALGFGVALRQAASESEPFQNVRAESAMRPGGSPRLPRTLAASVVIGLAIGLGAFLHYTWSGLHPAARPVTQAITTDVLMVPLSSSRSAFRAEPVEVRLSADTSFVVLLPQIPRTVYGSSTARLRDGHGGTLWQSELDDSFDGGIAVPASRLTEGRYELLLHDADDTELTLGSYTFVITGSIDRPPQR